MFRQDDELRAERRQTAASAEIISAAAAFTLGCLGSIMVEGMLGTIALVASSLAAVALLWAARWETEAPEHRHRGWEDIPASAKPVELAIIGELVIGAAVFAAGAVAFLAIEGTLGTLIFVGASIASVATLWQAHREAHFTVD